MPGSSNICIRAHRCTKARRQQSAGPCQAPFRGWRADLATGGLSLGGGTLVGALAGAVSGAGIARGINVLRGRSDTVLRWDDALLDDLVVSALLRYLSAAISVAVVASGRKPSSPSFWQEIVVQTMTERGTRCAVGAANDFRECVHDRTRAAQSPRRSRARVARCPLSRRTNRR